MYDHKELSQNISTAFLCRHDHIGAVAGSLFGYAEQLLAMEKITRQKTSGQLFTFGIYIYFKYIHNAKIINYF